MANFGIIAGGIADTLNQGLDRNRMAQYQQEELKIQQQAQQQAQQRFQQGQYMDLYKQGIEHMQAYFDQVKVTGGDIKQAAAAMAPTKENLKTLLKNLGQDPNSLEGLWASMIAAPASTDVMRREAAAKEPPGAAEERTARAGYYRAQSDPLGLGAGAGAGTSTGTIAPPNSNTFKTGESGPMPGGSVEELPPGAPLPISGGTQTAQVNPTVSPEEAKGDAFLASVGVSPAVAETIKAIADYRVNPSTLLARGTFQSRAQLMGLVQQYATARGQVYDQTNFTAKNKAISQFANRVNAISLADSELRNSLPILRAASQAVDRTQYSDINSIIQGWQSRTGGEAVVQLGEAIWTVQNLYARAINPTGGKPTVNDLKEAHDILQRNWSKGQIEAGITQMLQQVDAAKKSLPEARNEILGILSGKQTSSSSGAGSSATKRYKYNPDTGELEPQ